MFDTALLKMIKESSNPGLSHLIDQYTPLVYTIVKSKISSVCSEEDIEEIVSDVFIAFYNQIDHVNLSKGSLAAYLTVIAKRKAVDRFRKALRLKTGIITEFIHLDISNGEITDLFLSEFIDPNNVKSVTYQGVLLYEEKA